MTDESPDPVQDAEEQLVEEQAFELPDREVSVPGFLGSSFAGAPSMQSSVRQREASRSREPKTLEDLYSLFPKIGMGDWKIRVERISPSSWGGVSIAGILGDYMEPLSMDEFRQKFGGGHYTVMVMAPDERGDGPSSYRMMKAVKFKVPGKPGVSGLELEEDDRHMAQDRYEGGYGRPLFIPQADPPELRMKQLEFEARERERERREQRELHEKLAEARRMPDGTIETIHQSGRVALEEARESHKQTQAIYAEEIDRLRAELRNRDDTIRELTKELLDARSQAATTTHRIETEAIRSQREMHQEAINTQRQRHEEEVRRLRDGYEERLLRINQDQLKERTNYESTQQLERERIREEYRARTETLETAQKREIESLQRQYEGRFEDMKRTQDQQMELMRERCDREVAAIRESERTQASFAKETAANREQLAMDRVSRLEQELMDEKRKSEELFRQLNKPTVEALTDAANIARMTGMVHPSEIEQATNNNETTLQQVFGLGKSIIENAPRVLEKIAEQRMEAAQAAGQAPPMYVQHRPPQLQPPRPPMMQGPPRQTAPLPRPMSPHVMMPQRPIPGTTSPPLGMPLGSDVPTTGTPPPLSGYEPPMPAAVEMIPEAPAMSEQVHPASSKTIQLADGVNFPTEKVSELFNMLETAVQTNMVTPKQFAKQLVDNVGVELGAQLLTQFQPGDIVEAIRQSPGGGSTAIATRDGEKYVHEVYHYATEIIEQLRGHDLGSGRPTWPTEDEEARVLTEMALGSEQLEVGGPRPMASEKEVRAAGIPQASEVEEDSSEVDDGNT